MILEKLNKKVNLKKIMSLSSWIWEVDKITMQNLGARGCGGGSKGRWVERREKGRIREILGEWDEWDGGRVDMGAGK